MMSALKANPFDAGQTTQTRRRVWKHPELKSHSLLVLTLDRLYLAPLAGDPKPEMVAAAETGANLDDLLGPLATVLDLGSVRQIRLDLLTNSLIVEYAKTGIGAGRLTVTFATPETADACFTKIWRRLGEGFQLQPYKRDIWAAIRTPLMMLVLVLMVTAALGLTLNLFEDYNAAGSSGAVSVPAVGSLGTPVHLQKSPIETLMTWVNWRVVCAIGGVLAALSQVWLYRRLTQPPVSLELIRS